MNDQFGIRNGIHLSCATSRNMPTSVLVGLETTLSADMSSQRLQITLFPSSGLFLFRLSCALYVHVYAFVCLYFPVDVSICMIYGAKMNAKVEIFIQCNSIILCKV